MPDPILSAGLLLYKTNPLRFLLVHASGELGKGRPYGLPKGELDENEEPKAAAIRETKEETGVDAPDDLKYLGSIDYVDGRGIQKRVFCFSGLVDEKCMAQCASWEIDDATFFGLDEARKLIHPAQLMFINKLLAEIS